VIQAIQPSTAECPLAAFISTLESPAVAFCTGIWQKIQAGPLMPGAPSISRPHREMGGIPRTPTSHLVLVPTSLVPMSLVPCSPFFEPWTGTRKSFYPTPSPAFAATTRK